MIEVQIDRLVGPNFVYAGCGVGNLASMRHKGEKADPKKAALQGLEKMKIVADLGIPQLVLPPQQNYAAIWMANSATVTPSTESGDGKVHITIANLMTSPHRRAEAPETEALFRTLFPDFTIHAPVPYPDEGSANHIRFSDVGIDLFVYGGKTEKYPARQSREAQEMIVERHGIKRAVFAEQNPELIDQGVFHNDLVAFGGGKTLIYHPKAFKEPERVLDQLEGVEAIALDYPIESYVFNSQLLTCPNGRKVVLAPVEAQGLDLPYETLYVDVSESLRGGGGPACLRLNLPLTEEEVTRLPSDFLLTEDLFNKLLKSC